MKHHSKPAALGSTTAWGLLGPRHTAPARRVRVCLALAQLAEHLTNDLQPSGSACMCIQKLVCTDVLFHVNHLSISAAGM